MSVNREGLEFGERGRQREEGKKRENKREGREGRERELAGGECAASARPHILVHVMFTAFLPSR